MSRPKGSKNKSINDKIEDLIEEVVNLPVDAAEKQEAIDELEDLLASPEIPEEITPATAKGKRFLGYHPISGLEVWL